MQPHSDVISAPHSAAPARAPSALSDHDVYLFKEGSHLRLYDRLGKAYSGVRRSPNARTQFQISLAKLRKIQVYVAGDVVRPGAYPVSAAGTVLNALYAAGGPTTNGSFRRVDVRRGGVLVDSVDVYDYLTRGINPSGVRL